MRNLLRRQRRRLQRSIAATRKPRLLPRHHLRAARLHPNRQQNIAPVRKRPLKPRPRPKLVLPHRRRPPRRNLIRKLRLKPRPHRTLALPQRRHPPLIGPARRKRRLHLLLPPRPRAQQRQLLRLLSSALSLRKNPRPQTLQHRRAPHQQPAHPIIRQLKRPQLQAADTARYG